VWTVTLFDKTACQGEIGRGVCYRSRKRSEGKQRKCEAISKTDTGSCVSDLSVLQRSLEPKSIKCTLAKATKTQSGRGRGMAILFL
jgi:hypothetical protein